MIRLQVRAGTLPAAVLLVAGCGAGSSTPARLATLKDSTSYAIGVSMGTAVKSARDSIDLDQLSYGMRDVVQGTPKLANPQVTALLRRFSMTMQAMEAQNAMQNASDNSAKGAAYRKENGARAGVTTTATGLQYEVLRDGSGPKPAATDTVKVHYRGTLIDGTEFDSSYGDEPATFAANQVITGWTEALQLMQVGGKYRLVIPPELAYGEQGAGPDIGPNSTLVFEVELLGIDGR